MPREARPFVYRGWYCTSVYGIVNHKLCPTGDGMAEAKRLLRAWMSQVEAERKACPSPGPGLRPAADPARVLVHEALDAFLDATKPEVEPRTFQGYVEKLVAFRERFSMRAVRSLTEQDGLRFKTYLREEHEWVKGGKGPGQKGTKVKGLAAITVNHSMRVARQFLNWCSDPKRNYCLNNPWSRIKYLPQKPRERLISPDELKHLLARTADEDFRDMLFVMRFSTLRPQEARVVTWDMVNWSQHQINLPRTMVKTRRPRPITLVDEVEDRLRARRERLRPASGDLIFPSRGGNVWKADSLAQKFRRLFLKCVQAGLVEKEKAGERLVLYSTRHTRAVEMLLHGNDILVVSKEMGHTDVSTTSEHYVHLAGTQVTDLIRSKHAARNDGSEEGKPPADPGASAPPDVPPSSGRRP